MPADRYRNCSQSPAESQHRVKTMLKGPQDFFSQTIPIYPAMTTRIPIDSPLMTLLRQNLPSMRAACRSQGREKGQGRREIRSGFDSYSTGSKGAHSDVVSTADNYDDAEESIRNRIHELRSLVSTFERRREQRAADRQARRDLRRLYAEKDAELQREHDRKMEAIQKQMELNQIEHENSMREKRMEIERMEGEIRKLQRETELQKLKVQAKVSNMIKEVSTGSISWNSKSGQNQMNGYLHIEPR
ncbi:hypothetical protein HD554DRAFT_796587 [Boletus coccyginus]|nr:hypothetical protein HD554DRAFT_796587 [Boletus coccyginus]